MSDTVVSLLVSSCGSACAQEGLQLGFEGLELPNELLSHSSLLLVCGAHVGWPTPYGGGCEGRRGSVLVGVKGGGGVCWWWV